MANLKTKKIKLKNFESLQMWLVLLLLALVWPMESILADSCNEYVCGSVVSKCLLTQACQCKLTDCHCCQDCLKCMGELFVECCACLDMCPKRNETFSAHAPKSQIGDFDGVPELFDSLTAEDDDDEWTTIRFSMRANIRNRYGKGGGNGGGGGGGGGVGGGGGSRKAHNGANAGGDAIDRHASLQKAAKLNVNCTVIYLNACTTNKKCSEYCLSMGANSYRWFHDGCCECVGANCFNYGINESRCAACPDVDDNDEIDEADADYGGDDDDMSNWDYGEDEINFN